MKKIISLLTTLCIALSMLGTVTVFADKTDITEISTLAELEQFRDAVNAGDTYIGKTVKLTDDIDLGGIDFWGDRVETKKWTPIGNFEGIFDGNGHTISGLYINSAETCQGLFGINYGTIKNLHVDGEVISTGYYVGGIAGANNGVIENCYNTGDVKNRDKYGASHVPYGSYIGGIAGAVEGGGTIKNCYATGFVGDPGFPQDFEGVGEYIGGIAGLALNGTIENCYKTGYSKAGGIDYSATSVRGADHIGGIVGGVSGVNNIQVCFYLEKTVIVGTAVKSVDGGGSTAVTKAQLRGLSELVDWWDWDNVWEMNPLLCRPVFKAFPELDVEGDGSEQNPYLIPDLKTLDAFRDYINMDYGLGEGEYFKITNDIDMSVKYGTKTPVENEAYSIDEGRSWTPVGFSADVPFKGTLDGDAHSLSGCYINNAGLSHQGLFGVNEGAIKNLNINGFLAASSYSGTVAGVNRASGTIDNCRVSGNINIITDYTPSGEILGGISGQNDGKILNTSHSGNIRTASIAGGIAGKGAGSIENCSHEGGIEVSGASVRTDYAGGIAGRISDGGSIKGCRNSGDVNLKYNYSSTGTNYTDYAGGIVGYIEGDIENSNNTGNVEKDAIIGGIAGYVNGTIKNCQSSDGAVKALDRPVGGIAGKMAGGKIEKCYNISAVSSGTNDGSGGIVGRLEDGEVINCLSRGNISGGEYAGGVVGYALGGQIKNCCFYNTGEIMANKGRGIIGFNNESNAEVNNCYFYCRNSDSNSGVVKTTIAKLKSGEVTYLLNGSTSEGELAWYQNIDTEDTDSCPVLDSTHLVVLYDSENENYYNDMSHKHTLVHHAVVDATCTENGTGEYWKCEGNNGCDMLFSDANGETEITEIPVITATDHDWGAWSITSEPTLTTTGKAERICGNNNTHKDNVDLPILTDTTVWTEDLKIEPTETTDGSQAYTSIYGTVTVIIPALGHTHDWGGWSITAEPTETETGIAQRTCRINAAHKVTETVPVLTDTTVWSVGERVEPTETEDGSQLYFSFFGKVTVILPATGIEDDYSIKYENGKAVVSVPKDGTYAVIFADYENGRLLSLEAKDIPLVKGENTVTPQNFTASGKVRVMLWDGLKGMEPLAK